ncbi:hypothetical protein H4219_000099 [Mycoemilia scoparia]|uniref:Sulfurtransferase n=1 Tax=Mycoemilia scoparia TaxID=417184 RepID=A0A9W8A7N8_9FUNG|nr:hypothetical protein H4219_000099 [Mycoemilia scoparia]
MLKALLARRTPSLTSSSLYYTNKKLAMAFTNSSLGAPTVCSTQWLSANFGRVKVLDGSWHLPMANRDATKEFSEGHIKGAAMFDIDTIKDVSNPLPHMLPPTGVFNKTMDQLGISNNDHVVVYDSSGFGSACRVFWTFKAMGHDKVSVLDGGLLKWQEEGNPLDTGCSSSTKQTAGYTSMLVQKIVWDYNDIISNIKVLQDSNGAKGHQIVDARPRGRFTGADPEIRPGLSSGHMPHAISVPSSEVAAKLNGSKFLQMKSPNELRAIFIKAGVDLGRPIVTTCGSGVTAAILYVTLIEAGAKDVAVYDGSWTEYAQNKDSPIVKDA